MNTNGKNLDEPLTVASLAMIIVRTPPMDPTPDTLPAQGTSPYLIPKPA